MKKFIIFIITLFFLISIPNISYGASNTIFVVPNVQILEAGSQCQLLINYPNEYITYHSSDDSIANVSEDGIVTAISPGVVSITSSLFGGNLYSYFKIIDKPDMQPDKKSMILLDQSQLMLTFTKYKALEVKISIKLSTDSISYIIGDVENNKIPITLSHKSDDLVFMTITAQYNDGKEETVQIVVYSITEIKNIYYPPLG